NSNYLRGFTSERRDLNVHDVDDRVEEKFLSIARAKVRPTIGRYDRGVRWDGEGVAVHGTRWVSVYVPVWLYSYADSAKGEKGLTHYIAVKARNGNTMGSVPVSHPKIFALSCCLGSIASVIGALVGFGWVFSCGTLTKGAAEMLALLAGLLTADQGRARILADSGEEAVGLNFPF